MSVVPNKLTLPELETLLAAIKQEIARRETPAAPAPISGQDLEASAAPVDSGSAEPLGPAEPVPEPSPPPAAGHGIPTEDAPPPSPPAEDAPPAVIRYVHPASRALTWSGEGDMPDWVAIYLANGGSWSAMENAAEQLVRSRRLARALAPARKTSTESKR